MNYFAWLKKKSYYIFRDEKSSIEPEEIFFDAHIRRGIDDSDSGLSGSKIEVSLGANDFWIIGVFAALVAASMLGYDFYLQVFMKDKFLAKAQNNVRKVESIKAPRGIIYDKNLETLVSNEPSFDLVVVPADLPVSADEQKKMAEKISSIAGIESVLIFEIFKESDTDSASSIVLKENLDKNAALILEMRIGEFSGLKLEKTAVRDYKDGEIFSHILGYTAKISANELRQKRGYTASDYIGKIGIEESYENILKGENGEYAVYMDANHNILKEGLEKEPRTGDSIVLALDSELQKKAYELLDGARKKYGMGAVFIALNPQNGKILSLVSLPGFDNNLFSRGISIADYNSLITSPLKPLFNRAVAGKYSPGSSIKPFLGAAALEENIITQKTGILSTGSIFIGSNPETAFVFRDWKEGGHGWVNIIDAIAQSVNTFFYTIGGGYGDIKGLGPERIKNYLESFGFNNVSGVDIAGEAPGFIPTADWKQKRFQEGWFVGDTYNISIGQGYLSVTPLQLVSAASSIANGGILYKSQLADKIVDTEKNILREFAPEKIRENFISKENIEIIRKAMRETVVSGSARSLGSLPIQIAGKTGTAQFGKEDKTHAWFSGFAPYQNPEIAFVILIEGGGEGSTAAVPIAREILQWWAERNAGLTLK